MQLSLKIYSFFQILKIFFLDPSEITAEDRIVALDHFEE